MFLTTQIESCLKIISKNCRTQIRNKTDSFILTFKNIVLSSADLLSWLKPLINKHKNVYIIRTKLRNQARRLKENKLQVRNQ